jgi:Flp pilus assembly protein TadG
MFRRFSQAPEGNVAIAFALSLLPLIGLAGAALDYSRSSSVKAELQAATDLTALALAREPTRTTPDMSDKARKTFDAAFRAEPGVAVTTFSATRNTNAIEVKAKAAVPTTIMQSFGFQRTEVSAVSRSQRGSKKIEVVMALDNTGSMNQSNKMTELKRAANSLIDILEDSVTDPEQVKVGIVPFATSVRLEPATHRTDAWIDFSNGDGSAKECTWRTLLGWSYQVCDDKSDNDLNKATWKGCVQDRAAPFNTTDAPVVAGKYESMYPAIQTCRTDEDRMAMVQPLTDDFSKLRRVVSEMRSGGNTNVTIGIAWGTALLSKQEPFAEGVVVSDKEVSKFLIVLTDGDNTQDRFDSCGSSSACVGRIDKRTLDACTAAKSLVSDPSWNSVTLYTIRVIDGNATLLRNCASDPSKFFDVRNASQLEPVFMGIGEAIASLRLTQ